MFLVAMFIGCGGDDEKGEPRPDANASCADGLDDCGGSCVDTLIDPGHCGRCDRSCDVACAAGECVSACPEPTENCSGSCVDTDSDPANCAGCGTACDPGQVCIDAVCSCGIQVSYSGNVQPIFDADCTQAGCHRGIVPAGSLDLTAGSSYSELVAVPSVQCTNRVRVVPGDVDASYLYSKLIGIDMCTGSRMPKGAAPLSSADREMIRAWICAGAAND